MKQLGKIVILLLSSINAMSSYKMCQNLSFYFLSGQKGRVIMCNLRGTKLEYLIILYNQRIQACRFSRSHLRRTFVKCKLCFLSAKILRQQLLTHWLHLLCKIRRTVCPLNVNKLKRSWSVIMRRLRLCTQYISYTGKQGVRDSMP